MDLVMALHVAVYLGLVAVVGYSAVTNDWGRSQVVGMVIALAGMWLVFFLDDAVVALSIDAPIIAGWEEAIGAALMLPGLLLKRRGDSRTDGSPPPNGTGA